MYFHKHRKPKNNVTKSELKLFEETMFFSKSLFSSSLKIIKPYVRLASQHMNKTVPIKMKRYAIDQMEYLKSEVENGPNDWTAIKSNVLNIQGNINQKNIDGILLKTMTNHKKFNAAVSFANYLKSSENVLNLGSINGLLQLYYELGKENKLQDKEKAFILDTYETLYDQYKVLDSTTCERLLHALCVIDEWKKALKVLDDIHLSSTPSHSAYSTLIATLFKLNKRSEALKLIESSIANRRPLLHNAYEEWINYFLRKYSDKQVIIKNLDEICTQISMTCATVTLQTAEKIRETYVSLGWSGHFTKIRRQNGQCVYCKDTLDCLKLSEEEFNELQQIVKQKLIVGSDLFLKSSPGELQRFSTFLEDTAPYDIVLDALNISYAAGKGQNIDRIELLTTVVTHFKEQNKKILLIGRKHMLKWANMGHILKGTCNFFTDDLSQDDPYFITAAILSGAHTDIVSKDLLRGHRFLLRDLQLRQLFQRWQWQHQWMVFNTWKRGPIIQPPFSFTPCAQKKNSAWHLPFEREDVDAPATGQASTGAPDWSSWLCLKPRFAIANLLDE